MGSAGEEPQEDYLGIEERLPDEIGAELGVGGVVRCSGALHKEVSFFLGEAEFGFVGD